jgi:glutamate-1-semialdehyde 2,1-aminomutase
MQALSPVGPVYQAGTLSGNPIAMAAGLKTLEIISRDGFYEDLVAKTTGFVSDMLLVAKQNDIAFTSTQVGAMFGFFFTDLETVKSFAEATTCNIAQFNQFFHGMLNEGVNLAPSAYEAGFVSSAHTSDDLEQTVAAAGKVFSSLN